MIQALLFDYGGVITKGGGGFELAERLGEGTGLSSDEAWELLKPVWEPYICGKITEDQLWQAIETRHGQPIHASKRAIWNTWTDHMQPRPEMLELVKQLQDRAYTVGLLSNVIPNTAADIRAHGGYDAFDFLVLSCEVGHAKPNVEIYKVALQKLPGIAPDQVIFTDDAERNLAPAQELGMHTVLARDPQQIAAKIEQLL
jgi:putative hydrolase of the HAD superfamily